MKTSGGQTMNEMYSTKSDPRQGYQIKTRPARVTKDRALHRKCWKLKESSLLQQWTQHCAPCHTIGCVAWS